MSQRQSGHCFGGRDKRCKMQVSVQAARLARQVKEATAPLPASLARCSQPSDPRQQPPEGRSTPGQRASCLPAARGVSSGARLCDVWRKPDDCLGTGGASPRAETKLFSVGRPQKQNYFPLAHGNKKTIFRWPPTKTKLFSVSHRQKQNYFPLAHGFSMTIKSPLAGWDHQL